MPLTDTATYPTTVEQLETETEDSHDLRYIGVELEYPVAEDPSTGSASRSRGLRDHFQSSSRPGWLSDFEGDSGYMGSDHTGAEITSGILNLHTTEPEVWYQESINVSEEYGAPFGATGRGDTNFGLHMHVSDISDAQVEEIADACSNEWARVFFCTSIDEQSADPWRHGGVHNPGNPFRGPRRDDNTDQHYEFRLPEPMLPEHFQLVMNFWRLVEDESAEAAIDYARELVHDRDERLTAIQQYQSLRDRLEDWPNEAAVSDIQGQRTYTDESAAEWFVDLMGDEV